METIPLIKSPIIFPTEKNYQALRPEPRINLDTLQVQCDCVPSDCSCDCQDGGNGVCSDCSIDISDCGQA